MVRITFSIITVVVGLFASMSVALPSANSTQTLERRAEITTCYDSGFFNERGHLIDAINAFCPKVIGRHFGPNPDSFTFNYEGVDMEVKSVNGCQFVADNNCGRLLRKPVDECDTSSTEFKQGGFVTDGCSWWNIDPNFGSGK